MKLLRPRVFWLHFNRFGQKRGERVCTIHMSDRCIQVKKAYTRVPMETIYKGDSAPQPRFYLKGRGVVRVKGDIATITAT